MHILHSKKIEQPIEKLSESFLDLSLNWWSVGELKKTVRPCCEIHLLIISKKSNLTVPYAVYNVIYIQ